MIKMLDVILFNKTKKAKREPTFYGKPLTLTQEVDLGRYETKLKIACP